MLRDLQFSYNLLSIRGPYRSEQKPNFQMRLRSLSAKCYGTCNSATSSYGVLSIRQANALKNLSCASLKMGNTVVSYNETYGGTFKRQREEDEEDVPRKPWDDRRQAIAILTRELQLAYERLRTLPKDDYIGRADLQDIIDGAHEDFRALGISIPSTLDETSIESPKRKSGKVVFKETPELAFFEPERVTKRTKRPRHASLEETVKHRIEMQRALEAAMQNPRWYHGGQM